MDGQGAEHSEANLLFFRWLPRNQLNTVLVGLHLKEWFILSLMKGLREVEQNLSPL